MKLLKILAAAFLALVAFVPLLRRLMNKNPKRGKTILGQQYANALEKEHLRTAGGNVGPSPLQGEKYHFQAGELGLINPMKIQLDGEIQNLCKLFRTLSEQERNEFRKRAGIEDLYTFWSFANRASVFAMRERNQEFIEDGLVAISMIESERMDFRDIPTPLPLLSHSAERIGMDATQAFDVAAKLAEPAIRNILAEFLKKRPAQKSPFQAGI